MRSNLSQSEIEREAVIQDQLAEHHEKLAKYAISVGNAAAYNDHMRALSLCIKCAAEYRARLK